MRSYTNQPSGTVGRARAMRREMTDAERVLWNALRNAFPHVRWRRQVPIGPYFADFLCFTAKLIVEADGDQHDVQADYDARRTRLLEREGYRVIRFGNPDILSNIDGVLTEIAPHLPLSHRERGQAAHPGGEGDRRLAPSPSHSAAPSGPLPLPVGEGK